MKFTGIASILVLIGTLEAHAPAAILVNSYTQNFDSMGTSGTSPPADWSMKAGESGTSNTTWSSSIPAAGATGSVASMIGASTPLTATNSPAATNNNGFNAASSASDISNRVLATSPTSVSGGGIELLLTNGTGSALSLLNIGYDIRRFTVASTANELPGYQLFYSLSAGTIWTNVAALNPTLAGPVGVIVPNTVGVTTVPLTSVVLSGLWNDGANLLLRWVDDNAVQTSPDQIVGLDNVIVSVPEPAFGLFGFGLLFGWRWRSNTQSA